MRGSNCISIHKALTGLDSDSKKSAGYLSISIHKALTGLDGSGYKADPKKHISIHKALTGLDDVLYYSCKIGMVFQSTRPSRASTCAGQPEHSRSNISIHKALTGLDSNFYQFFPTFFSFLSIMLHFSHSTPLPIQKSLFSMPSFPLFQVRIFQLFHVHFTSALKNQRFCHIKSRLCPYMLHLIFILVSQIIKSQAVFIFINKPF